MIKALVFLIVLILVISYICRKDNASSEAAATSKKLPKK
jgi:hypothetical protein